jgi:hypothetical protein
MRPFIYDDVIARPHHAGQAETLYTLEGVVIDKDAPVSSRAHGDGGRPDRDPLGLDRIRIQVDQPKEGVLPPWRRNPVIADRE